ncbi:MAG: helix-turn-helix domain-containing protein [archaeon]
MTDVKEYLQRLGLNSYQASTLTALFENPNSDAKLLSEASKVPYTKIYETLDFLESRGLVKYTLDKPRIYKALEPEAIFDSLLKKQTEEAKKLQNLKQDVLDEVKIDWKEGEEKELSKMWVYNSSPSIGDLIRTQFQSTKRELLAMGVKATCVTLLDHPGVIEEMYGLTVKRKATAYTIFPSTFSAKDFLNLKCINPIKLPQRWYKLLRVLSSKNYHIRLLPEKELNQDIYVRDGTEAGIAFKIKNSPARRVLGFEDKSVSSFMKEHYMMLWDKAEPIGNKWHNELKSKVKSK